MWTEWHVFLWSELSSMFRDALKNLLQCLDAPSWERALVKDESHQEPGDISSQWTLARGTFGLVRRRIEATGISFWCRATGRTQRNTGLAID